MNFSFFLVFEKGGFQDEVNTSCCRKHVKGGEATSNTKIVANKPATTVIIANIIDQTFMIFLPGQGERPYW